MPAVEKLEPSLVAKSLSAIDVATAGKIHLRLTRIRAATTAAQLDFSQAMMVEPGDTQETLMRDVVNYLRETKKALQELGDFLLENKR